MSLTSRRMLALTGGLLVLVVGVPPLTTEAGSSEPYRIRHFDLAEDLRRNELSFTNEERLGFPARKPRDGRGVRLELCGDGTRFHSPGTLAINAMKRLDAYIEEGDPRQLEMARKHAAVLRRLAFRRGNAWFLPYWCDYLPAGQRAPWFNAMSQGLALSLLVRLHQVTGAERHLDDAWNVFRSFRRFDRSKSWVSYVDGQRYLWLEHYPRSRPDHILNAHLHAIFGLYELWRETRSARVRWVLEGAITTMRDHAGRYRRPGGVSWYGLRSRSTIAKYHAIHVWQLRLLARISGDPWFWRLAGRLARDSKPFRVPGRPQIVRRPGAQDPAGGTGAGARALLAATLVGPPSLEPMAGPARTERVATRRSAPGQDRAAGERVRPDFDGDGFADLAVGAPCTNIEHRDTGAVHVFYGSPGGLRSSRRQLWSQASEGIADKPEQGDQFGWSVASGDFDGDGFSDLAIGARWEGRRDEGAVHVLYGSPDGLRAERSQLWRQDSPGIKERGERMDQFGWALAAADFDGDGRDDLAIGVPFEDRGGRDTGVVQVLYGSPTGLRASRDQLWHQDSPGIADRAEAGDHFGMALAAGDFDGDGRADLAIGVGYESRRVHRMGIVHVLHGSRSGLTARGSQVWHQDVPGIRETASMRDQFGQSLAAGDFDRDGFDDLVVGVWFEDYRNQLSNEGGFHVIYGSRRGLRATGNQFWHRDRPGLTGPGARDSDRFGQALGVADFDGDGFDDIAVGSPSSDLGRGIHQNRGAVHVFYGSRRGITARGDQYLTQDQPGIMGRSEAHAHFGETVAGADFDGDGFDELAVGIPYKDLDLGDEGAVHVIHGSPRGLDRDRERVLSAQGSGLGHRERRGGRFGWALSGRDAADGSPRIGRPDL